MIGGDDDTHFDDDDDEDVTIQDIEDLEEDEDEFEGIDYSNKNLLIQLLMNQQLSAGIPITSRVFDKYTSTHYEASSVELQGYRDNMEDQHLIHFKLKHHPNCSVFGVFDGHGGDLTSKFVKKTLIPLLEQDEIKEFDDKSLTKVIKQLDLKWIHFENKRKKLKQKQIRKEQERIEREAIMFTQDSDDDNQDDDIPKKSKSKPSPKPSQHKKKRKKKAKPKEEDIAEKKENDKQFEDEFEDELMREMLSSSISDDKDKKKDDEDTHPMTQSTTNEYGSVGSTVVFSIVEYNEKDDNYRVCNYYICLYIHTLFLHSIERIFHFISFHFIDNIYQHFMYNY